jgi:DNA repair exonuclease SbcCD nuclease subunit
MAKVAFIADVHLGVSGRLQDILWGMRVVREYCKKFNIDVVVILGDLFHNRESLGIDVLFATTEFFEETERLYNQRWIALLGNHDMFLRHSWEINSLAPLRKHLTIIEDIRLLTLDDRRFFVLPFIQHERAYMKVLKRLVEYYEDGDVLLTHIGVRGSTLNSCFLLKDWSVVSFDFSRFKSIYTGHFHLRQTVNDRVHYPGSLIPFKFDEGDEPHGFYVYDLVDQTHKFINIWKAGAHFFPNEVPPPQFHTFLDEKLSEKTAEEVKGNTIRIMLQNEYTKEEKREMKDRLIELGARKVSTLNLFAKIERTPQEVLESRPAQGGLFRTWVDADKKGIKDLDVSILNQLHEEIIHEGDQLYSTEEVEL